jgi:uncharacterized membrane protein
MTEARATWTDERLDQILGNLLRFGVVLSAVVVLMGGCIYLSRHGAEEADHKAFQGESWYLSTLPGILAYVGEGRGRGIIQLGIVLLIATPVARVLFSVFAFALQRDRTYVVVTTIVFLLLVYSLAGGFF